MSVVQLPPFLPHEISDPDHQLGIIIPNNSFTKLPQPYLERLNFWKDSSSIDEETRVVLQVSVSVQDEGHPTMCAKDNSSQEAGGCDAVTVPEPVNHVVEGDGEGGKGSDSGVDETLRDSGAEDDVSVEDTSVATTSTCSTEFSVSERYTESAGESLSIHNLSVLSDSACNSAASTVGTSHTTGTEIPAGSTAADSEQDDRMTEYPSYCYIMKSLSTTPLENTPKMNSEVTKAYKSVLKKPSSVKKGHRVVFNESLNTFVDSDYVIYIEEEPPPQLINIPQLYQFDSALNYMDHVTLSPPEGYKDIVNTSLIRESLVDEDLYEVYDLSDEGREPESDNKPGSKSPDGGTSPTSTDQSPSTSEHLLRETMSVECSAVTDGVSEFRDSEEKEEQHDNASDMAGADNPPPDPPSNKLKGILKGGKIWKKSAEVTPCEYDTPKVTFQDGASHRRSVRFQEDQCTSDPGEVWIPIDKQIHSPDCGLFSFTKVHKDNAKDMSTAFKDEPIPHFQPSTPLLVNPTTTSHKVPFSAINTKVLKELKETISGLDIEDGSLSSLSSDGSLESRSQGDLTASDVEMRLRRLENSDVAHIAQGIIRSNSQIRRTIERNALRRSLIKCSEVKKRELTGSPSDPSTTITSGEAKLNTSLEDKLKWLTSLDLEEELKSLDGISRLHKNVKEHSEAEKDEKSAVPTPTEANIVPNKTEDTKTSNTDSADRQKVMLLRYDDRNSSYKKLSDIFKRSDKGTHETKLPTDVREWKITKNVLEGKFSGTNDLTVAKMAAMNGVSMVDPKSVYKLSRDLGVNPPDLVSSSVHIPVKVKERSSWAVPNGELYTLEDINTILKEEMRLSGQLLSQRFSPSIGVASDSGYTSSDTSGTVSSDATTHSEQSNDELLQFVQNDLGRIERLKKRYSLTEEDDDGGFSRRPSVRGIKPKFGSTNEILKQMQSQLQPPLGGRGNQNMTGSHLTWPYKQTIAVDEVSARQQIAASQWRPSVTKPSHMLPSVLEENPQVTSNRGHDQKYASACDLRKLNIEESNMDAHHIFGRRTVPPDSEYDPHPNVVYRPPLTPDSALYVSLSSQNVVLRNHNYVNRTLPRGTYHPPVNQVIPISGLYIQPRPLFERPVSQQSTYPLATKYHAPMMKNNNDASPIKQTPTPLPRTAVRLQGQRCASWCQLPSDSILFPPHPLPRTTRPHLVFPTSFAPHPMLNKDERGVPEGASSSPQNMVDRDPTQENKTTPGDRKQGDGVFYALKI